MRQELNKYVRFVTAKQDINSRKDNTKYFEVINNCNKFCNIFVVVAVVFLQ